MNILIDIGGSGVKISTHSRGTIGEVVNYGDVRSVESFVEMIRQSAGGSRVEGIAISAAGFVNADEGKIIRSRVAEALEGNIVRNLNSYFPFAKIAVVNDGEAHARALLYPGRNVRFGAIHLAFGTSVSFGVINEKKQIVRTCSGENWDLGDFELRTREAPYEVWYKLGSKGLQELEGNHKIDDPYVHFGWRLGNFLRNLAVIFRPRTIGLSGGIISSYKSSILKGVRDEFRDPVFSEKIDIVVLSGQSSVMEGLTTLL